MSDREKNQDKEALLERLAELEKRASKKPWRTTGTDLRGDPRAAPFIGVVSSNENAALLAEARNALPLLLGVAEAAQRLTEYEQIYQKHVEDWDEEHPTCTVCEEWGKRCWALEDALEPLLSQDTPRGGRSKSRSSGQEGA